MMLSARDASLQVQVGDLLACSGSSEVSKLIRLVSPTYSHVALICSDRPAMVAESTASSSLPDSEDGMFRVGVQVHLLADWLAAYDGTVHLLQLRTPLAPITEEAFQTWIELEHRHNVGYDFAGVMRLGVERVKRMIGAPQFGSLFCSEMAAEAYKAIGLLTDVVPSECTPDDASQWPLFRDPVQLK